MCNVCDADEVIKANTHRRSTPYATFRWEGREEGLEVWSEDVLAAEFSPGTLRVRVAGAETWSEPIPTGDLAGSLSVLGVDGPWEHVDPVVQAWIGGGAFQPVHDQLLKAVEVTRERPKARLASLKEWRKKQADKAKKRLMRVLKLPAFCGNTWSVTYSGTVWHAKAENGTHFTLRPYLARGLVRKTRITLRAPLSLDGTAESIGTVLEALSVWKRQSGGA